MNIIQLPKLWKSKELAKYLDVNEETLARERKRGNLGYTRIGERKIRYTDKHVQEYLRSKECTATSSNATTASGTSGNTTSQLDSAASTQLAREIARKQTKRLRNTS